MVAPRLSSAALSLVRRSSSSSKSTAVITSCSSCYGTYTRKSMAARPNLLTHALATPLLSTVETNTIRVNGKRPAQPYVPKRAPTLEEVNERLDSIQLLKHESTEDALWTNIVSDESSYQGKIVLYNRSPATQSITDHVPPYIKTGMSMIFRARITERELHRPGFRMLIVVPNREEALTLERHCLSMIESLTKDASERRENGQLDMHMEEMDKITVQCVTGGRSLVREINILDYKEPEVVIATPGRLLLHLQNSDYFRNVKLLVMDFSDQLLSPFIARNNNSSTEEGGEEEGGASAATAPKMPNNNYVKQLRTMLAQANKDRITICMNNDSTVLTEENIPLRVLQRSIQETDAKLKEDGKDTFDVAMFEQDEDESVEVNREEKFITVQEQNAESVKQATRLISNVTSDAEFYSTLVSIVKPNLSKKICIYAPSAAHVDSIISKLKENEIYASNIGSNVAQKIRNATFLFYNSNPNGVLVTTDVVANSLRPNVDIVIHAEPSTTHPLWKLTASGVQRRERCCHRASSAQPQSILIATGSTDNKVEKSVIDACKSL